MNRLTDLFKETVAKPHLAHEPDDQLTTEHGNIVLWLRHSSLDSDRIRTTPDKAARDISYQGDIYTYRGMVWRESSSRYELEYSILQPTSEVP